MKGIIFNLLERVVSDKYGSDTWDSLLTTTGLTGAYTSVGNYSHDELLSLVGAASESLGLDPDELVRWFGRSAMPLLSERYPAFFQGHADTRNFLMTLNNVIHPEVRKLFPGAYAPNFEFEHVDDAFALSYLSHRNLCSFAEGLIEGAAEHFGEIASITQSSCTKRGDDRCTFVVRFSPAS